MFTQLLALEVSADYYTHPPGIVSFLMLTITYMQPMAIHMQVQQPYSMWPVQYPGHDTSVMGEIKMGNIVPRVGIEPTSLAFRVSVLPLHYIASQMSPLPLHHIASQMSPLYPHLLVYAAPCLRCQCRLLHKHDWKTDRLVLTKKDCIQMNTNCLRIKKIYIFA